MCMPRERLAAQRRSLRPLLSTGRLALAMA